MGGIKIKLEIFDRETEKERKIIKSEGRDKKLKKNR